MDDVTKQQDYNLQQNPGQTNPMYDMTKDEELPEDNSTPFSPPNGIQDRVNDTFPPADTNIQPEENYEKGIEGASGTDLPGMAADEDDADIEHADTA